ncbi:glutaredoxin family protein [Mycobacterium colombiense]|uniref:glutaredoxin family protein n=1 Tax=Mycobacterium colombiense TaxID=339268 RepID=UPI00197B1C73|nr:glutaredoxin family protein [Mycobacterium colombiense]
MIVKLYSLPGSQCPGCKATKREFSHPKKRHIPYEEIRLDTTPGAVDYVKSLGYVQSPVVVVDYGDGVTLSWSGHQPTKIDQLRATLSETLSD